MENNTENKTKEKEFFEITDKLVESIKNYFEITENKTENFFLDLGPSKKYTSNKEPPKKPPEAE